MKKTKKNVYGLLTLIHAPEGYWAWEISISDYPTSFLPYAKVSTMIRRGSKAEALKDARGVENTLGIIEYKIIGSY